MITRLSYDQAVKQFVIVGGSAAASLAVPVVIRKVKTERIQKEYMLGQES